MRFRLGKGERKNTENEFGPEGNRMGIIMSYA